MTINIDDWRNRKSKITPRHEPLTIEDYERRIASNKVALSELQSYPRTTAAEINYAKTMSEHYVKDSAHCDAKIFELRTKSNPTQHNDWREKKAQNA